MILVASDINVKPKIVPNCFNVPENVEMMIAGTRTTISVDRTKAIWAIRFEIIKWNSSRIRKSRVRSSRLLKEDDSLTFYHTPDICKKKSRKNPTSILNKRYLMKDVMAYLRGVQEFLPHMCNVYMTFRK